MKSVEGVYICYVVCVYAYVYVTGLSCCASFLIGFAVKVTTVGLKFYY